MAIGRLQNQLNSNVDLSQMKELDQKALKEQDEVQNQGDTFLTESKVPPAKEEEGGQNAISQI